MAITSNIANLATVTRASKAWDPGAWDFVSGSAVGPLVEYASGVARTPPSGLLVEESGTNLIRNPRFEGATLGVIGSGGVLPTYMSHAGMTGLEITAIGTEGGWDYMEIEAAAWTPSGNVTLIFETGISGTIDDDTSYTTAAGVKLVTGSTANMDTLSVKQSWYSGVPGTGYLGVDASDDFKATIDASHRRFFASGVATTTAISVRNSLTITWSSGALTFKIRVYAPQAENKAYPTSPILPDVSSPAETTRAADDISIPNGDWSNDDGAGSIYAAFTFNQVGQAATHPRVVSYSSDNSNRVEVLRSTTSSLQALSTDGGVAQSALDSGVTPSAATQYKLAVAWDTNDMALSVTGGTQATDTSCTIGFGAALLRLGQRSGGGDRVPSMYLAELRYFPRRLTNTELESLVGN